MFNLFFILDEISHSIHIIILTLLPLFLIAIEVNQIFKTKIIHKKMRRMHDLVAIVFAIVPLERYVLKSISIDKPFMIIINQCLWVFLIFLIICGISEAYVTYGFPLEFLKRVILSRTNLKK